MGGNESKIFGKLMGLFEIREIREDVKKNEGIDMKNWMHLPMKDCFINSAYNQDDVSFPITIRKFDSNFAITKTNQ